MIIRTLIFKNTDYKVTYVKKFRAFWKILAKNSLNALQAFGMKSTMWDYEIFTFVGLPDISTVDNSTVDNSTVDNSTVQQDNSTVDNSTVKWNRQFDSELKFK